MKPTEVVQLVRVIEALCPGQRLANETPDAWSVVLDDVAYDDALAAVRTIYRDGDPGELGYRRIEARQIIDQVRRLRRDRLAKLDPESLIPPLGPDGEPLTVREELRWLRRQRAIVAAGGQPEVGDRGELVARNLPKSLTRNANTA